MKFTCERNALQAAVSTASRATSPRSPIPTMEGLLAEAGPNYLKLTGYDLKKGIYTTIDAEVEEEGKIILSSKMFGNIINSLPQGEVTVKTQGQNVSISCENTEFHIIGTDAADYPELPELEEGDGTAIPQNLLGKMIRQTIFAVSDNESRPVYTGELFEISEGNLTLIAVDGYRLSLRREKIEGMDNNSSFIVPGTTLSDLEKLCADTDDQVKIKLSSKHISFSLGQTVLISRRLEGEFLNYRTTVPNTFNTHARVDKLMFQRAVERVSLIIDDRVKNPIRCVIGEGQARISCITGLGKAEDLCSAECEGTSVEIGFNNRYVLDALKAISTDEIMLCLNSGSSPCVILPTDGEDSFLYMILPVRLKA